jgi:DeoR/GlpR family transcriptional regulator of sugar metabolism
MNQERDSRRVTVPAERRRAILEMLRDRGSLSVVAVEEAFGVSSMTARRDLAVLAEGGHLRRTHGGALLPELASHEDSFPSRVEENVASKRRLAAAVVSALSPEETIFVDSSSSAYFVVRALIDAHLPATLLTNAVQVMALACGAGADQLDLIGLGGSFRRLSQSFVGAQTVSAIESFFADRVVFSVKGIQASGHLTDADPLEAQVKRAMVQRARTVTLLAAGDKFDQRGLSAIVHASVVTEAYLADAPAAGLRLLSQAGVRVIAV